MGDSTKGGPTTIARLAATDPFHRCVLGHVGEQAVRPHHLPVQQRVHPHDGRHEVPPPRESNAVRSGPVTGSPL